MDFDSLPQPVAVMAIIKADIAKTYIFFIRFTSIFLWTNCPLGYGFYSVGLILIKKTPRSIISTRYKDRFISLIFSLSVMLPPRFDKYTLSYSQIMFICQKLQNQIEKPDYIKEKGRTVLALLVMERKMSRKSYNIRDKTPDFHATCYQ